MDEITSKWDLIGLLTNLPESIKHKVALKYDLVAIIISENEEYYTNTKLTTIIFPIIYRIYFSGKTIGPDVNSFVDEVFNFLNSNRLLSYLEDLKTTNNHLDLEAEMCVLFVKEYLKNTKIEPLNWVVKHKI